MYLVSDEIGQKLGLPLESKSLLWLSGEDVQIAYDLKYGEGAWNKLTNDTQDTIISSCVDAMEWTVDGETWASVLDSVFEEEEDDNSNHEQAQILERQ